MFTTITIPDQTFVDTREFLIDALLELTKHKQIYWKYNPDKKIQAYECKYSEDQLLLANYELIIQENQNGWTLQANNHDDVNISIDITHLQAIDLINASDEFVYNTNKLVNNVDKTLKYLYKYFTEKSKE